MASDFQVRGTNDAALFTLRVHRGDGMALLAMNWRGGGGRPCFRWRYGTATGITGLWG